jgi:hypothetical protein
MALSLHASTPHTMVPSLEAKLWYGGGVVATWLELGTVDIVIRTGPEIELVKVLVHGSIGSTI